MVAVYRIITNVDTYQCLSSDVSMMEWGFDGVPIAQRWAPQMVYSPFPLLREPAFWGCFSMQALFAVEAHIQEQLYTFIMESCELLPIVTEEGREFTILHVTNVLNCLNKKESICDPDPELSDLIDKYVFRKNRFGYSLFKIPETRMVETLCVEGRGDPEDEFKGFVEKHGLKGLLFDKIWSEDDE